MRIDISSFRGEAPRLTPRALPLNGAQEAVNARLQSGDLESWRQFALTKSLAQTSFVDSIYLLNGEWLSWTVDVDVARGIIPGDNTYRIYLTGPDLYDQPRWTNFALATTGSEPYPVTTRPLGVPNPDAQPTLVAGVVPGSTDTIEVLDNGDQLTEAWTISPQVPGVSTVSEDAAVGNGPPSYTLVAINNTGDAAWLYRDFGIASSSTIEFSFDFRFNNESVKRMLCNFLADNNGAGFFVNWGESGVLNLGLASQWSSFGDSVLGSLSIGVPSGATFYTCQVRITTNENNVKTLSASVYQGSSQIGGTLTVGAGIAQGNGGNIGFILQVGAVPAAEFRTWYDNISALGAGSTALITQIATSYVYTFVNDIDEESGPSPASATILKDDGTSITVTTPTAVQSGFSVDYSVQTKRIYRAVTGNTGTAFLFVAEIPLSQADYVDELTDSELGDALESEDWDLPPDDLKGILALPNGVMAGFRRNQLCFSAQNRPHAWPVKYRLNTDTDIVNIGNIDNTVVIGTQAFPYLATGNDPSAYSMTKLEVPQACVSKRSFAYLTGIGVVFASPDGLIAVSGNGQVRSLTEAVFTRRQWQALDPTTVVGIAHDDVYHFWYGASGYSVSLDFEAANGSQIFTDQGSAESVWTPSGPQVTITTSSPLAGSSSLSISTQTAYLSTTAVPGVNMLPAEADFDISMRASATSWISGSGVGVYLLSIQGTSANASDTQFAIATDQFRHWAVVLSDGATRSVYVSTALAVDGTGYAFLLTRRGSAITLYVDGVAVISATFTGSLNVPTGRQIRIGQPEIGTQVGAILKMDTIRFFAYNNVGAGYALDMKPTGFGLIELSYHARATHADPLTDKLYLLLDSVDEPNEVYQPVPSTLPAVVVPYVQIFEFDSEDGDGDLVFRWKGKLNRLPHPLCFVYCQVKADDYNNALLNLYADGSLLFTQVLTDKEPFTLPMLDQYETFEIELVGTSRVESVRVAESIEELMQEG